MVHSIHTVHDTNTTGNEMFEKLGTVGSLTNLVVYLTTVFNMKGGSCTCCCYKRKLFWSVVVGVTVSRQSYKRLKHKLII
jgi:hypothetical protein